jgi:hypothetical protein
MQVFSLGVQTMSSQRVEVLVHLTDQRNQPLEQPDEWLPHDVDVVGALMELDVPSVYVDL